MTITFRPAVPSDIEALYQVKIAAFVEDFKIFNYAEANAYFKEDVEDAMSDNPKGDMFSRDWHKQFCTGADNALVIEDGTKVIGNIIVLPCKTLGQYFDEFFGDEFPGYDFSQNNTNILMCIYVLPEYKNKGVGKAAIEYVERLHPSEKWVLSTPAVSAKNKHFYESCGYKAGTTSGPDGALQVYVKKIYIHPIEQKKTKPRIEDVLPIYLDGEKLKNAMDFVAFLRENKMSPGWRSPNSWCASYKGKVVAYIKLGEAAYLSSEYDFWQIVFFDHYNSENEELLGEQTKKALLSKIRFCKSCPDFSCAPGIQGTVLGEKLADNICRYMSFLFNNPTAAELERAKQLVMTSRKIILANG